MNKDKYDKVEDAVAAFEKFCDAEKAKRFDETGFHACGGCPLVDKIGGCFINWIFSEVSNAQA